VPYAAPVDCPQALYDIVFGFLPWGRLSLDQMCPSGKTQKRLYAYTIQSIIGNKISADVTTKNSKKVSI
jgi:hypothetical protein